MRISWRLAAIALTAAMALAAGAIAPAHADKRVALVIGNGAYVNVPRLVNPANDARLMAETLRSLGFTLVGGGAQLDLDEGKFRRVMQDFGDQLQGADVGLFYYAGHGVQVRGANYLVPVGSNPTRESDVDLQMLDSNVVLRQMEGAGTKLNVVILDACRNNPFGGRGLRATDSGLAQMRAPEGTLISFATQPNSVAQDGADGNSPYTKALAQVMRRPGLDIFRTFNEVGLAVASATGGSQQPWVSASPIKGDFYFAGTPATATNTPATADPAAQAWAVTQNTTSVAVLEDFIRQFGTMIYGSMARARLEELKKAQVAVVTPPREAVPTPMAVAKIVRSAAVGGQGGDPFDDAEANFDSRPISGLRIVLNQNPADASQHIIGAIQMQWDGNAGPLHGGRGPMATPKPPLQFAPGEVITKVAINAMAFNFPATPRPVWVAGLRIVTNKSAYTFGNMSSGQISECSITPGQSLVGFYGRSGSYIDRLGCIVASTK
jgi:uncharacterized caspase-like protein